MAETTVEIEVRRLLEARLDALAGHPVVQWENRTFTPPSSGSWVYLRCALSFVQAYSVAVCADGQGDELAAPGLLLVDVFSAPGVGTYQGDLWASKVLAWFRLRARLTGTLGVSVRVDAPYRSGGLPSPQGESVPSWMVACTIPFVAYHPANPAA